MRFFAFLVIAAVVYVMFVRHKHAPEGNPGVVAESAQATPLPGSPGHSNILKRPLDRTHAALDANRARTSDEP